MKPWASTIYGRKDPFEPTHWSVVLTAAQGDKDSREVQTALATLCQTYWSPLYTYLRSRGHDPHEAQDLTQGFFEHLIEHRIYERTHPSKGKFRSFLLAATKNFLINEHEKNHALKRGGRQVLLPLHEAQAQQAEGFLQSHQGEKTSELEADRAFELSWAQALVDAAMLRVGALYAAEDKQHLFETLRIFIAGGGSLPAYDDLGASLGMRASTLRSHVTRLRALYRKALFVEVRQTVDSEAEAQNELKELLRVLVGS